MPDILDDQLNDSRARLLAAIQQPELGVIATRARSLRRRRYATLGATALALLTVVGLGITRPWQQAPRPPDVASADPLWSERGVTLNGLPRAVPQVDGQVYAVEFPRRETGFALLRACGLRECELTLATSTDGGATWTTRPAPFAGRQLPAEPPPVLVTAGTQVTVVTGATWYHSADGGLTWAENPVPATADPLAEIPADARPSVTAGGCDLSFQPVGTPAPRRLNRQPGLVTCRAAPAAAAGGAWWVGGRTAAGGLALEVTRDRGLTWQRRDLPAEPGAASVLVNTLGLTVFAVVLDGDGRILAIHRSTDRGETFQRTAGATPLVLRPDSEPVPLLDGRLLLLAGSGNWYVSDPAVGTFAVLLKLGQADRIVRTASGYVVYNVFKGGWCAFTADGSTWQKLNLV